MSQWFREKIQMSNVSLNHWDVKKLLEISQWFRETFKCQMSLNHWNVNGFWKCLSDLGRHQNVKDLSKSLRYQTFLEIVDIETWQI